MLEARGISCSDEARASLMACDEVSTLQRWLSRAKVAGEEAEVFSAFPDRVAG